MLVKLLAGLLSQTALALNRAAQEGNATEAERIDQAFAPLWALFREFGSFQVMFAIAEILGFGRIKTRARSWRLSEHTAKGSSGRCVRCSKSLADQAIILAQILASFGRAAEQKDPEKTEASGF